MAAFNKVSWEQVLSKGDVAGALSLLSGIGLVEPLSQSGAGPGQIVYQNSGNGVAWVLPGTGATTWFYDIAEVSFTTGQWITRAAGVAAGGTTVGAASAGNTWLGYGKRLT
jgi:hypothetical protein